jgi:hypothetical protein
MEEEECKECNELEDACPKHAKEIHESWHKVGFWWIREEMCHENCPGLREEGT